MWIDLETGEMLTKAEMIQKAETVYEFDDFTPWNEIYNYFEKVN